MPYLTIAQAALDRWRAATREMDAADPESDAWKLASQRAQAAKADYLKAIDDATRTHNRVPVAFEEATQVDVDDEDA